MNEGLIKIFSDMAFYEDFIGRKFPAKAYRNAVQIFKDFEFDIIDPDQIKGIPGIGDGILKKVTSFLESGTFSKYEEFKASPAKACMDVAKIKGFGVNKAKKLFEAGIKSIDDLKNKVKNLKIGQPLIEGMNFTKAMKIGLDYEAHTDKTRMTVEQHDAVANPLIEAIKKIVPVAHVEAVGSRRRFNGTKNYTIGDIDIIIDVPNKGFMPYVQKELEKLLDEVVMSGETKVSGIKSSRQVDFRIVTDHYEALRLHATGPMSFNIKCRKIAISKGWTLNEYGLFDTQTKELIEDHEKFILEKLGIGWIEPADRKDF